MVDEILDLHPAGVFKSLYAAIIDRIRLDQSGIELVLADELAKAVAEEVLAISSVPTDRLGWALPVVDLRRNRPGGGAYLE